MSKLNFRALIVTAVTALALTGTAISQGEVVPPSPDLVPTTPAATTPATSSTTTNVRHASHGRKHAHRRGLRRQQRKAARHHSLRHK